MGVDQKKKLDDLTLKLLVGKVLPLSLVKVKELDPCNEMNQIDKLVYEE